MNVILLNVVNFMCFYIFGMQIIIILIYYYGVVYIEVLWEIIMVDFLII